MEEFKVGNLIVNKNKKVGLVVYVHPTDEPTIVVDYGEAWFGEYAEDIKFATPKQSLKFMKKYSDRIPS